LCYSCDKDNSVISIESQIQKEIEKQGRGWIFFPADFSTIGQLKAVSKALERLSENGQIIRLTREIYYYPKIDEILGLGYISSCFFDLRKKIF